MPFSPNLPDLEKGTQISQTFPNFFKDRMNPNKVSYDAGQLWRLTATQCAWRCAFWVNTVSYHASQLLRLTTTQCTPVCIQSQHSVLPCRPSGEIGHDAVDARVRWLKMFQGMFFSGIPVTALKETHTGVTTVTVIILTHCDTQLSLSSATQQKPK